MPDPITMSITALAGTGAGMVVLSKMFDLLLTKWKSNGSMSFGKSDRAMLHSLHDAHMVNAKDAQGQFKWWGGETTDAVKENTEVLRDVLKSNDAILVELKRQNGSRTQ